MYRYFIQRIDWSLFLLLFPLLLAGLLTMKSFGGGSDYFFWRQLMWIGVGLGAFFIMSNTPWRIFDSSGLLIGLYGVGIAVLVVLLMLADTSWFQFSFFAVQPSEFMKPIVVLVLAKYFSRRHVEIAHIRHIFISALYAAIPAVLVFFQPDFGSALIFPAIWGGMVIASGIPFRHLLGVLGIGVLLFGMVWMFALEPYQKDRIATFLNPYLDPQGAGYHTLQAKIAVGSGGFFGQGIGYGSQSRLQFLPEHETDFIFGAFAEEWGFVGSLILLFFFTMLIWYILHISRHASENFVRLFAIGISFVIMSHFVIHVGMNLGILPITGLPLPFVSYGGSHLLMLFATLGIWNNMRIEGRIVESEEITPEWGI